MDEQPLVIDFGSSLIRAGFGGDDAPRAVFPDIIGSPKYKMVMCGAGAKDTYVGDEAQSMRGMLHLRHPISKGIVSNWDDLERMYHHLFYNELRSAPEEHYVFLTEPLFAPRAQRERICEILFDTFTAQGLYMNIAPMFGLYGTGLRTGLVVDVGHGQTKVVPIVDGHIIKPAIESSTDATGGVVSEFLVRLLNESGVSFTTGAEIEFARWAKERHCFVSEDLANDLETSNSSSTLLRSEAMYDGTVIPINSQRFRAPEVLFQPSIYSKDTPGVHQLVVNSIMKCDVDVRASLFNSIISVGCTTHLPGYAKRLESEIRTYQSKLHLNCPVKIISLPERSYTIWIGLSLFSVFSETADLVMSRTEYEEYGPNLVHSKFTY